GVRRREKHRRRRLVLARRYRPRAVVITSATFPPAEAGGATAVRLSCIAFIHASQLQTWLSGCPPGRAVEMPNGIYNAQNRTMPVSRASKPATASITPSRVVPVSRTSPPRKRIPPSVTRKTLSTPPTLCRNMIAPTPFRQYERLCQERPAQWISTSTPPTQPEARL